MKSSPPGMAMPSCPSGIRMDAKVWPKIVIKVAAVILRKAVPMPIGLILSRLLGSLCNAMTYCAPKSARILVGMLLEAMWLSNVVNESRYGCWLVDLLVVNVA